MTTYPTAASGSIEICNGLLEQKLGLLTNNLDMKTWTKAIWEAIRQ